MKSLHLDRTRPSTPSGTALLSFHGVCSQLDSYQLLDVAPMKKIRTIHEMVIMSATAPVANPAIENPRPVSAFLA